MMNDSEGEAGALARLIQLLPDEDVGPLVLRLIELGDIKRIAPHKRFRLAERLTSHDPEASEGLLHSVIDDPDAGQQRPDAMLALAALKRETDEPESKVILGLMATEYPLHPAVELARSRGWIA